ncbi:MAG: LD-carboxypeptidase, partial [Desulfosarcina sp.]
MTLRNHPQLKLPRALKSGDTIGIAAPSSPFDRSTFEAGIGVLETMGFKPVMPEDLFDRHGYLAGADLQRAERLNRLFADPEIDGIVCARGG